MRYIVAIVGLLALLGVASAALQMRGSVRAPDTNTFYFDVIPSSSCQLVDERGGYGSLSLGASNCDNGVITLILMDTCDSLSTHPYTNDTTPIGDYWEKSIYIFLNSISYTELRVSCYDPTPAEIIEPPVAVSNPATGGPSGAPSPSSDGSSLASSLTLFALAAMILVASVL